MRLVSQVTLYGAFLVGFAGSTFANDNFIGIQVLPKNAHEASVMVRNGDLDSSTWEMLEPYYIQPLHVPSGELRLLSSILDADVRAIPATEEVLKQYRPWTKEDQNRFFANYPTLKAYEPILSFEQVRESYSTNVNAVIQVNDRLDTKAKVRFGTKPLPSVELRGTLIEADSIVVWDKRVASWHADSMGYIDIGNFCFPHDNGLIFGFFPADTNAKTMSENWLYGKSRTWNGVSTGFCMGKYGAMSGMIHSRFHEQVLGAFYTTNLMSTLSATIGISKTDTGNGNALTNNNSARLVHCGAVGTIADVKMEVQSGIDTKMPLAIPVSIELSQRSKSRSANVFVAHLPASCNVPLSKVEYWGRKALALETGSFADITYIDALSRFSFQEGLLATTMELRSVISSRATAIEGQVSVEGKTYINYDVRYSCNASSSRSVQKHAFYAIVNQPFGNHHTISPSCRYSLFDNGTQSLFIRIPCGFFVNEHVTLTPFTTAHTSFREEYDASFGMTQTVLFFKKIWLEWMVEYALDEHNKQTWDANVRAHFLY